MLNVRTLLELCGFVCIEATDDTDLDQKDSVFTFDSSGVLIYDLKHFHAIISIHERQSLILCLMLQVVLVAGEVKEEREGWKRERKVGCYRQWMSISTPFVISEGCYFWRVIRLFLGVMRLSPSLPEI